MHALSRIKLFREYIKIATEFEIPYPCKLSLVKKLAFLKEYHLSIPNFSRLKLNVYGADRAKRIRIGRLLGGQVV